MIFSMRSVNILVNKKLNLRWEKLAINGKKLSVLEKRT